MELMDRSVAHLPEGEGRSLWVLGGLITYKVTAEQTGGAYSLFEAAIQPRGSPLPHVQHQEDECFYVLEGRFEFLAGHRWIEAGAGSLVYVPRGNLHTFRNVGKSVGRVLVSQTPGVCTRCSSRRSARRPWIGSTRRLWMARRTSRGSRPSRPSTVSRYRPRRGRRQTRKRDSAFGPPPGSYADNETRKTVNSSARKRATGDEGGDVAGNPKCTPNRSIVPRPNAV